MERSGAEGHSKPRTGRAMGNNTKFETRVVNKNHFKQVKLKDCGLILEPSNLFELSLELLDFELLHWSELNISFISKHRTPLLSGREDKDPHMLLAYG